MNRLRRQIERDFSHAQRLGDRNNVHPATTHRGTVLATCSTYERHPHVHDEMPHGT